MNNTISRLIITENIYVNSIVNNSFIVQTIERYVLGTDRRRSILIFLGLDIIIYES